MIGLNLQTRVFVNQRPKSIKAYFCDNSTRERCSRDGIGMNKKSVSEDTEARVQELQIQVADLKELVNTLLSVICEEPDGVASGAAPSYGQPKMNYCM